MAADSADMEAAKIGAAAERKRREESDTSIEAILKSDEQGGKAVYWRRRIRANGEVRESLEAERAGTYGGRAFLRLAEKAAGQAGKGRWNRPEAVEAVAAELVTRVMAKTGGVLPKVGSLGRDQGQHENPDLAYLTATARTLIVSAMRGDRDAAGLAAEAAPVSDAADGSDLDRSLGELMGEADTAAEGQRDPYLSDPPEQGADLLNRHVRAGASTLACLTGTSDHNGLAAIVSALRGNLAKSADLSDAGYGSSPAAARKAAQRGREALRPVLSDILRKRAENTDDPDAEVSAGEVALSYLCENEDSDRPPRHIMEGSPQQQYRKPKAERPAVVTRGEEIPPIVYYADAPDWRTV
jgi:hypothetical protein